jgi:aminoacrylate hydrolase
MPVAKGDGADLYWEMSGSGPPLILAAGLGGVLGYWQPNRAALEQHFTLCLFDQRGTGKSSKTKVDSIEQMSTDLLSIMDAAGLSSAHYLGHSTGGAIGVATALDHPGRLRSLMIYASTTHGDAYRRRIFDLRRQLHAGLGTEAYAKYSSLLLYPPYWINANHDALVEAEINAARQLGDPEVQASRLDAILAFDRRSELQRISIQTMIVCADDDILTPRYFSEDFAARIPNAKTCFAKRGGHALSRTEPDIFNQIAVDFFRGASSS